MKRKLSQEISFCFQRIFSWSHEWSEALTTVHYLLMEEALPQYIKHKSSLGYQNPHMFNPQTQVSGWEITGMDFPAAADSWQLLLCGNSVCGNTWMVELNVLVLFLVSLCFYLNILSDSRISNLAIVLKISGRKIIKSNDNLVSVSPLWLVSWYYMLFKNNIQVHLIEF